MLIGVHRNYKYLQLQPVGIVLCEDIAVYDNIYNRILVRGKATVVGVSCDIHIAPCLRLTTETVALPYRRDNYVMR